MKPDAYTDDYDSFLLIKTGNGLDPVTADVS